MPPRIIPAHPNRVLAFFPHRRVTGRAALDGPTLVPRSFASLDMRHAHAATDAHLELLVARSIERFRPALVAIGVLGPEPDDVVLARAAERVVRHFGIETVVIDTRLAARLLVDACAAEGYDQLGQAVARHVPELASHVLPAKSEFARNLRRRRSFAWKASVAALAAANIADLHETRLSLGSAPRV